MAALAIAPATTVEALKKLRRAAPASDRLAAAPGFEATRVTLAHVLEIRSKPYSTVTLFLKMPVHS